MLSEKDFRSSPPAALSLQECLDYIVMFGSSRYVVNPRGIASRRNQQSRVVAGESRRDGHSDDPATATSIVSAHDVFRRDLPRIISSTLYRTKRIQRNGNGVVILACAFSTAFSSALNERERYLVVRACPDGADNRHPRHREATLCVRACVRLFVRACARACDGDRL